MFIPFFYALKQQKIPVTTGELLDFIKVVKTVSEKNHYLSSDDFYHLARNCLVKDLKYYDQFDLAFVKIFKNIINNESDFFKNLEEWLNKAIEKELSDERKEQALKIPIDELMNELMQRINEQKERHDGGNHWIGTGGTSPFGHSGFNPNGIRIGGASKGKSAIAVAEKRNYQEYRNDNQLNVRQIKVALKTLRDFKKLGREEISIPKTLKKSCDSGGEIEIVMERSRKNQMKLILLMDVGGSMTPYSQRVEQLFSAAHQLNHFKEFHFYYFHNIIYDYVYKDARLSKEIKVDSLYKKFGKDTRVIYVGDAAMAPYEYFQMTQNSYNFYNYSIYSDNPKIPKENRKFFTGKDRLEDLKAKFPNSIWFNPEPQTLWNGMTANAICQLIPMYFLSLQGITDAIKKLKATV